jgi:hypothetical protein
LRHVGDPLGQIPPREGAQAGVFEEDGAADRIEEAGEKPDQG